MNDRMSWFRKVGICNFFQRIARKKLQQNKGFVSKSLSSISVFFSFLKKIQLKARTRFTYSSSRVLSALVIMAGACVPVSAYAVDVLTVSNSNISGSEDVPAPLGISVDPAFNAGGAQLDVIGTDIGFFGCRRYRLADIHYSS